MSNFRFARRVATAEQTYDFPPFRPPSEADSLLLRVTRGCPWNRCAFCPMYKDVKFEKRPIEQIKKDINAAREFYGKSVETVFIGDSDSLITQTDVFCDILDHIYNTFTTIKRVTSYARAHTLKRKSLSGLKKIRRHGLTRLHIGLETGSREILKQIKKGATPETMVLGCSMAKEARFEVSLYVLLGIGGKAGWKEHASHTAKVINRIGPDFIRVRTLTPQPGTPVYDWWKDGLFEMCDPRTVLEEQKTLIRDFSVKSEYLSDHISNYARVDGSLPEDKAEMLLTIDETLQRLERDNTFKCYLQNMPYLRNL